MITEISLGERDFLVLVMKASVTEKLTRGFVFVVSGVWNKFIVGYFGRIVFA